MHWQLRSAVLVLGIAGLVAAGAPARAQQGQGPLPRFSVHTPDGHGVSSESLSAERQWLLVYLEPGTAPNNELVRLLAKCRTPRLAARTVLVVSGSAGEGRKWLEDLFGEQPVPVAWYADTDLEARRALELPGAPMMAGMRDGQVMWRLLGVLSRPESLESMVRTWVELPAPQTGGAQ